MSLDLDMEFDCEHCHATQLVGEDLRGRAVKCTGCGQVIIVPGGTREQTRMAAKKATRPCESCGKPAVLAEQRCRHCGAWTGMGVSPEETRRLERIQAGYTGKGALKPTGLDYTLAILCPWVCAPVALGYLLIGYTRRGMILLPLSFCLAAVHLAAVAYVQETYPGYLPF